MPVSKTRQVELRALAAERKGTPYLVKQKNKHIIDKMREHTQEIVRKVDSDGNATRDRLEDAKEEILQAISAQHSNASSSSNDDKLELYARIMQLKVADIKCLLAENGFDPRGTKILLARIAAQNLTCQDVRDFERQSRVSTEEVLDTGTLESVHRRA